MRANAERRNDLRWTCQICSLRRMHTPRGVLRGHAAEAYPCKNAKTGFSR
eukprot:CAMPEP_0176234774 /NCGR_PEP_ID=MMETSP0121_2-20121125/26500_1 /TAXON_ID=160619 /ORGANISM="Kryptoperidinium foliaceum, Strain CCMP 1326" /LENGTH=49 /DNA_ID=CAMNT_0017574183 /DNA_START=337 /DNA_END=486 /DNA_ORIENTATION=+